MRTRNGRREIEVDRAGTGVAPQRGTFHDPQLLERAGSDAHRIRARLGLDQQRVAAPRHNGPLDRLPARLGLDLHVGAYRHEDAACSLSQDRLDEQEELRRQGNREGQPHGTPGREQRPVILAPRGAHRESSPFQTTGRMSPERSAANACAARSSASYSLRHSARMFARKWAAVITVPLGPSAAP